MSDRYIFLLLFPLFDLQEGGGGKWGIVEECENLCRLKDAINLKSPVDLFFGITMRLVLHRGFFQRLVSPYAVGLSVRNCSEIY
jgi:hypothetical protein